MVARGKFWKKRPEVDVLVLFPVMSMVEAESCRFFLFFYLFMKIVQEYTKISTISIKAFKTELLNKFNSRSPCFTARKKTKTLMSSL